MNNQNKTKLTSPKNNEMVEPVRVKFQMPKQSRNKPKTAEGPKSSILNLNTPSSPKNANTIDFRDFMAQKNPSKAQKLEKMRHDKSLKDATALFALLKVKIVEKVAEMQKKNLKVKRKVNDQLKMRKLRQSLKS